MKYEKLVYTQNSIKSKTSSDWPKKCDQLRKIESKAKK